jgi:hypothetical protein
MKGGPAAEATTYSDPQSRHRHRGGFKVPADTSACDASKFGTLRWNATVGLQVCNKNQHANGSTASIWTVAISQPILWSGGGARRAARAGPRIA